MRRRVMISSKKETENKENAVAGDILCAKDDGSKRIFARAEYNNISGSGWTPIGVVVIPTAHDVYGTGEGAAISLCAMSLESPDTGTAGDSEMYFGDAYAENIFSNPYVGPVTTDNKSSSCNGISSGAELPSYFHSKTKCYTDNGIWYGSTSPKAPSPYLNDGSRNPEYYTDRFNGYDDEGFYRKNALSDFNGKGNTDYLLSLATGQVDWRTASTIKNSWNPKYYPAVCCCWRYYTIGTKQGDWYLPSAGELGYLMAREHYIDDHIYLSLYLDDLWTSTPGKEDRFFHVNFNNRYIGGGDTLDKRNAVAFIRF